MPAVSSNSSRSGSVNSCSSHDEQARRLFESEHEQYLAIIGASQSDENQRLLEVWSTPLCCAYHTCGDSRVPFVAGSSASKSSESAGPRRH